MIIITNRSALSTVIGGAVFLVLLISGFATFLFAMDVTSDRFSEQLSASFEETLRGKEKFSFIPSVDPDGKLFVEVRNEGSTSLNVVDVWVSDQASDSYALYDVSFQDAHIAPNERKQVLSNHPDDPIIIADGSYDVKVVTELGTMHIKELIAPLDPLIADVFVTPQNIGNGHNATISMFVYNRGNATVYDVSPVSSTSEMTNPSTSIEESTGPTPSFINALKPEESVIFSWNMQLIGAVGTETVFTNSANGTDSISGGSVTSNVDSGTLEFVPTPVSLVQRPDISLMIPNPSGESGGSTTAAARWGVTVSNPTNVDITVSRVIVTAVANSATVKIFERTACSTTKIPTSFTGTWDCPADNVLMWENLANPVSVPARSAVSFLAEVETGSIGSGVDDPATMMQATVYTAFGPTSRGGIVSGLASGNDHVVANIYASDLNETKLSNGSILGNLSDIDSGSQLVLNVTLADFGTGTAAMADGTRIVITIPSGFEVDAISDVDDVFTVALDEAIEYPDGSHLISGKLDTSDDLGLGNEGAEAVSVKITLTAPTVTSDALYTVFAMAEGVTDGSNPISPVVEIPIQVNDCNC